MCLIVEDSGGFSHVLSSSHEDAQILLSNGWSPAGSGVDILVSETSDIFVVHSSSLEKKKRTQSVRVYLL